MSELDGLEDARMHYEHLTHLLSDYQAGVVPTTPEDIDALRQELRKLEAVLRTQVQMPLLHEGTDVWRPVDAFYIGPSIYRIEGRTPDGEEWAFSTGVRVRCEQRRFDDGATRLTVVAGAD